MTLYARSDMMSVGIPVTSGGCGNTHSRPVRNGSPAKIWGLDCPPCESYLRGSQRAKIIHVHPGDKDRGIPSRMEHVADTDPHWSSTPEGIPLTPDEQNIHKVRIERGEQELSRLQALAAIQAAGIKIPEHAQWLLEQTFDPRLVKGMVVCPDGHDNVAGGRFCQTCGVPMNGHAQLAPPPEEEIYQEPEIPLSSLHVATLKKMCRERGLPATGKKEELLARLS
jgi:SAP domain